MPGEKNLKAQFEAILGRPLDLDRDDPVVLRENVGVNTFMPSEDIFSKIVSREIGTTGDTTKRCQVHSVLNATGAGVTNSNGSLEFLLSDFLCTGYTFIAPANMVATPRGRVPAFLTITHNFIRDHLGRATDIKIKVFSWNATGAAANIPFDWQCIVPAIENQP